RRLGAVVQAYDVRPAVREQVESLGADFVDLGLDTQDSEDAGGYARAQSEEFYDRQREALGRVVAENNVVISTAAIPGKPSPVLIIEDAVRAMAPGSVIVDLAAERGGNCVLTQANETVVVHDVQILGPTNLPATVPYHASQMFANNVANFLELLVDEGELNIDLEDEIVKATLVTQGGEVVNEQVKGTLAS
ncbi:MAG: NAD(P)(+) transhydrogenase (Re/Si-specific) subunit alpha, partial [Candidatus Latescibacteria bacterium]|nr:NAD(P)(+) transhydrogenase (Re/Si-specific) subunit alpha [Candidatus Latescibacterota bacterium]